MKLGSFNMVVMGSTSCNNSIVYIVKNSNNPIGALIAPGNTTNLCLPVAIGCIGSWALTRLIQNIRLIMEMGQLKLYTQAQKALFIIMQQIRQLLKTIPHTFSRLKTL
jgi:hypothetical protein